MSRDPRLSIVTGSFRLLFLARGVSVFGDYFVNVALAFAILDLTASASNLSLVLAAEAAAMIAAFAYYGSVFAAVMQQSIPLERLSRASSYEWLGSMALMPLGYAIAGPLESVIGLRAFTAACRALDDDLNDRRHRAASRSPVPLAGRHYADGTSAEPGQLKGAVTVSDHRLRPKSQENALRSGFLFQRAEPGVMRTVERLPSWQRRWRSEAPGAW